MLLRIFKSIRVRWITCPLSVTERECHLTSIETLIIIKRSGTSRRDSSTPPPLHCLMVSVILFAGFPTLTHTNFDDPDLQHIQRTLAGGI